jgi:hypothetical protein
LIGGGEERFWVGDALRMEGWARGSEESRLAYSGMTSK